MIGAGGSTGTWEAASVAMALTLASAFVVGLGLGNEPYRGLERRVQTSAAESADIATAQRITAHVQCLRFASRAALHAQRSYLRAVDPKAGPTGQERGVWLGTLDPSRCAAGLAKARTRTPALPALDAASDAYLRALEQLSPLLNEASAYYGSKHRERDQAAKAKTLHTPLVAAFADFQQAHTVFAAEVQAIDAGPFLRQLERLEQDPAARLEYLAAKTVHDARGLAKPTEHALKRYASTAADYERYVSTHADEASKVEAMSLFRSQVGMLLKSATQADAANIETDINELVSRWHGMKFRR